MHLLEVLNYTSHFFSLQKCSRRLQCIIIAILIAVLLVIVIVATIIGCSLSKKC